MTSWGNRTTSINVHQRYLAMARQLGDRAAEAVALGNLDSVYDEREEYGRAVDYHRQDIALSRELGLEVAPGLVNLANGESELGQYMAAVAHYREALALLRKSGDRWGEGLTPTNLGETLTQLRRFSEARELLRQALDIARELGAKPLEEITCRYWAALDGEVGETMGDER